MTNTGDSRRMKPASTTSSTPRAAEQIDDRLIVGFAAGKRFVIEHFSANAVFLRARQTVGVRFVAQHDLDLRVELFRLDRIDDRLQIGAAAGNQNADRNLPCHKFPQERMRRAARAAANFADHKGTFRRSCLSVRMHAVGMFLADHQDQAQTIVERAIHLRLGNARRSFESGRIPAAPASCRAR